MRVLYITTMYPTPTYPQKGIFCHDQVKALIRLGLNVDVVVPIPIYETEIKHNTWTYEGVKVHYVRFFKIPGATGFHRIGYSLFYALNAACNLVDYDIYHADTALPSGQAAMIASTKYGKPFIVHGHGLDVFLDYDYAYAKNRERIVSATKQVYMSSAAITGVSGKVIDNITARLDVKNKCYVVYNGVDTSRFYPRMLHTIHHPLKMISVGNLIDLKGHDLVIRTVARMASENNRCIELNIYGRGEKERYLKKLVKELGAEENIHFRGYINNDELAEAYRQHDLFILASWYEALGCVYLEAMASGLITIGCRQNGIEEIIMNGKNGFLITPHSQDSIQMILNTVLDLTDKETEQIKCAAIDTITSKYTWNDSAESLLKVYDRVWKS